MARSRRLVQLSRSFSISSSEMTSFTVFLVLILWMRRMGLFRMWSSSSSHEKKLEMFRRMLSMVALLQFRRC